VNDAAVNDATWSHRIARALEHDDGSYIESAALMGTVVTMQVVDAGHTSAERHARREAVQRAFAWFHAVEAACSRFEATSELRALSQRVGEAVVVSPLLFQAVQFACRVAETSGGAFDPTVGVRMEQLGFNREYRHGMRVESGVQQTPVSWRDLVLDADASSVTLLQPMVLDLGAVAKGLAIDLAKVELQPFADFAIDAGGDLYLGGRNAHGRAWHIGIRHPRDESDMFASLQIANQSVCTSGDYERRLSPEIHHLLDARDGRSATLLASVTVVAESAMVADALATAAFAMGPVAGAALLNKQGVDALLVTPSLERLTVGALPVVPAPARASVRS
jgi:FAD:protein FMN transferase